MSRQYKELGGYVGDDDPVCQLPEHDGAMTEISTLRWHLLHAEAELANAHWTLARISGRAQYAEHGEDTEDQQALREIGEWCRKELGR